MSSVGHDRGNSEKVGGSDMGRAMTAAHSGKCQT
jgi:hypothetical protein